MRGTCWMREMLHSRECRQTIEGLSSNNPGNVLQQFGKCRQAFQEMSPNIPGNVLNIPENILKQCNEYFFANSSPLYTDFNGNKHTKKQSKMLWLVCNLVWNLIFHKFFRRFDSVIEKMKINLSRVNDK